MNFMMTLLQKRQPGTNFVVVSAGTRELARQPKEPRRHSSAADPDMKFPEP
jgi:hypothetical protein